MSYEMPVIVRVELDHMKHQLNVALAQHSAAIREMAETAVAKALNPESIAEMVSERVRSSLVRIVYEVTDDAIRHAIDSQVRENVRNAAIDGARAACERMSRHD